MKKFIKNTLLSFVIVYTILNLLLFVNIIVLRNSMLREVVTLYLSEERDIEACAQLEQDTLGQINEIKELYGEEVPATGVIGIKQLIIGISIVWSQQLCMLIIASILSVAIGIILSLTEKPKIKEVLYFITGGISVILLCAVWMYVIGEYKGLNIIEAIIETIPVGIYYTIGYLIKIVYRYCKNKKNVKELNKELENKNK